ncbi:MAG: hypothetical protein JST92_01970 [Deltaproteobacteria bacterium]|nr:hypothetical protein [Deltaproteobacteria bacterium]
MPSLRSTGLGLPLLTCALLAASCSAPVVAIDVTIVTKACAGATNNGADLGHDPSVGVDTLRLTLSGDGLSTQTVTAPFGDGTLTVPNVPLGTNRRVVVEALKNTLVRARADSGLFDALDGSTVQLSLFLRVIDSFTFTTGVDTTTCSKMVYPRAGHAMTLLGDGRVLITGGYTIQNDGLHYLNQAEVYDPKTGLFSAQVASPSFRRGGHAALAVQLGAAGTGVIIAGGEGPSDPVSGSGNTVAIKPLELFNTNVWQQITPPGTSPTRTHQSAAVDLRKGFVVIAGGLSGPDVPGAVALDGVSWFDPQQTIVKDSSQPLAAPLADAVAVARANKPVSGSARGGVVLVGGRDANGAASAQVSGVVFNDAQNQYIPDATWEAPALNHLPSPRVRHVGARTKSDSVVIAGGASTVSSTDPYANTVSLITVLEPDALQPYIEDTTARLSQARADSCGVALNDGTFLVAGGATKLSGVNTTVSATDLISPDGRDTTVRLPRGPNSAMDGGLQMPRHRAACVRLLDGSVLITGGLQYGAAGAIPATLDSAEIFMPAQ